MKYNYSNLVLVFMLFCLQAGVAQYGAQKRADYYFGQFAYSKAIKEYEKMLEGGYNMEYAHQQLAECYLLVRNFKESIPHFEAIIENSNIPTDYYFKYAMALYTDGQLEKAEEYLKRYKKFHKNDSRVKRFLKDGNLASVVFNSRQRYDLEAVAFNSEESEFGVYATNGNLYFASSRKDKVNGEDYGWNEEPWLDLFEIREGVPGAIPQKMKGDINSKFHESSVVFTTDYKQDTVVYFTRNNYFEDKASYSEKNKLNLKIFKAEKKDGTWSVTKSLPMNSDHYSTGHPFVSPDGKRLYYTSDRPGGKGGTDIYYSEIYDRGRIGPPINAGPEVNTEGNEMFPFVNHEGQLFFASDGHVGFGQLDIYSTISGEDGEILDVINLGAPINSPADDFAYFAHEDGIFGYISSNREGGKGGDDIYRFQFTPSLSVEGYVYDGVNNQPLNQVAIRIYNQENGALEGEALTDENGYYRMFINRERNYMMEAVRTTHPHKTVFFNTFVTPNTERIIQHNVVLEPVLDVKLLANLNKIYFDFNKAEIRPDAAQELDKVVKLMTVTYPEMVIRLESHTDPVGSHAYNDDLSERRARSTYEYLISKGVPKERILSYKGFGKRELVNDCLGDYDCTPEELELNRRTEFPIVQIKTGRKLVAKN